LQIDVQHVHVGIQLYTITRPDLANLMLIITAQDDSGQQLLPSVDKKKQH